MNSQMNELTHITDALFQVEQAKMQRVAAQEAAIRKALSDLETQSKQATGEDNDIAVQRALGADLLWQVWVGRKRADLQMELAKVLVLKAQAVKGLKYAFGKNQVAQELLHQEATEKGYKAAAKRLQTEQSNLVL